MGRQWPDNTATHNPKKLVWRSLRRRWWGFKYSFLKSFHLDAEPTTRRPTSSRGGPSNSGESSSFPRGSSSGCPRSIDAFTPSDSFSYLFSGNKVYSLSTGGKTMYKVIFTYWFSHDPLQSYDIGELFPSAPSHVDAAVFNPNSGLMILFAGGKVSW